MIKATSFHPEIDELNFVAGNDSLHTNKLLTHSALWLARQAPHTHTQAKLNLAGREVNSNIVMLEVAKSSRSNYAS